MGKLARRFVILTLMIVIFALAVVGLVNHPRRPGLMGASLTCPTTATWPCTRIL
ncbi:hypothetical protein [Rhizobium halophytocola]|uniref:Uncharacterized protein n=1 Tax=Rhizobium halophytocola TaxID=735519 RepID=A0ABS4E3B8_9HYPH|nr:hypothetical protein [Rhizobium halophytocola]MBP1852427.1 hypothetical protein [Rhizobium halophytocola]